MNRLQTARQVQKILRALTWTDTGLVFASESVKVTMGFAEKAMGELILPAAFVRPGASVPDPDFGGERPDLVETEFAVSLVVASQNDQFGETALVGANRVGGSTGCGLLEVETLMLAALFQQGPQAGLPIIFRGASQADPKLFESLGYVVFGDFRFKSKGTLAKTYQKPAGLVGTGGAGSATLSWNAAVRWDARRFILRYASGATAPATAASGTGVTLGGSPDGAGVTSKVVSLAAGTYSFALFAVYDDVDAGSDVATSASETVTSLVVT